MPSSKSDHKNTDDAIAAFTQLGLCKQLADNVINLGYSRPTEIQSQAIPSVLTGKNLIAAAQTGTGKTAGFILPILEQLRHDQTQRKKRVRAIIITPTRELAIQIHENTKQYSQGLSLNSSAIYGGVDDAPQKEQLIEGVDIVVTTPGRLLDLYGQRAIRFDEVSVLVLDEADRMLDMGFIEDINKIIARLPQNIQNLLFSATLSEPVRALARSAIIDPIEISVINNADSIPEISQWLITVDKDKKSALLAHIFKQPDFAQKQALIFIRTKHGAAKLVEQLKKRDISADCIHSGRSQAIRTQILTDFKSGKITRLIATGVAARGIDIDDLPFVINYDMPDDADDYVHRIGRTGRAGATGQAVSLVSKDDFKRLCAIERRINQVIERREIEGFTPQKVVPESNLNFVPPHKRNNKNNRNRR